MALFPASDFNQTEIDKDTQRITGVEYKRYATPGSSRFTVEKARGTLVVLAANAILHSGDDSAKKELLPGFADGSITGAVAITPAAGFVTVGSSIFIGATASLEIVACLKEITRIFENRPIEELVIHLLYHVVKSPVRSIHVDVGIIATWRRNPDILTHVQK